MTATILLTAVLTAGQATLSPADAVALAASDATFQLDASEQPFQRYLYLPQKSESAGPGLSLTLNSVQSTASTLYRPTEILPGQLYRVDLRRLAPKDADFITLRNLWEYLADVDPYLHTIRTTIVPVTEYTHTDGKKYRGKRVNVSEFAIHTGLDKHLLLASLTQSKAPILRLDWFVEKSLTTLDGGLYYVFRNYRRDVQGKTDQQLWLERHGASEEQVAKLRSDERAALFFSGVTSRQRRIDVFYGVGVRPSAGVPLVSITHDISSIGNDPAADPLLNLLEFKDAAREAIAVCANGHLEYALFDAKGKLQDAVPPDVAHDSTIPNPYDQQLTPGGSCIRCHLPHDGWIPFGNDVQRMMAAKPGKQRLDVFDDATGKGGTLDTLDRLAGLYAGQLEPVLKLSRNAHADAVFRSTGKPPPEAGAAVAALIADYRYRLVDAKTACIELGIEAKDVDDGIAKFNEAIPSLPVGIAGFAPESGILGALKAGISVQRKQWEREHSDAALRRRAVLVRKGLATP